MVWLVRPPYLRYAAAAVLILGAVYLDLRPTDEVDHPFITVDVTAGTPVESYLVDWRPITPGLLPPVDPSGIATADIVAGTPLVPSLLTTAPAIPPGWFALEISVPDLATPGSPVRIVMTDETWTDGVVIALAADSADFISQGRMALVAVPGETAGMVADAAGRGSVTVLLGG